MPTCAWIAHLLLCFALPLTTSNADAKSSDQDNRKQVPLSDLLDAATKHSPVLNQARLAVQSADGDLIATDTIEAFQLAAGVRAGLSSAREASTLQPPAPRQETLGGDVTVSKLLPTGGALSVDLRVQQVRRAATTDLAGVNAVEASAGVNLQQPLMRFRGQTREQLRASQTRLAKEIAYCQLRSDAIDEVYRIASAYRLLAVAEEVLEVRRQGLALAKQQLVVASAAVRSGVSAASEKSSVEQAIYTREAAVVAAKIDRMERSLDLRELVGLPIGPSDVLMRSKGLVSPDTSDLDESLKQVLRRVLTKNPRLMVADLHVLVRRNALKGAEQVGRPQLDLLLSGRTQAEGYEVSSGLQMQWDMSGQLGRGLKKSARAEQLSAKIGLLRTERAVSAEAIRSYMRLEAASRQASLAAQAVEYAIRNVELEEKRFKAGDVSSFDVLLRQDELARARITEVSARTAVLDAADRLRVSTGELLDNYDLVIDSKVDY